MEFFYNILDGIFLDGIFRGAVMDNRLLALKDKLHNLYSIVMIGIRFAFSWIMFRQLPSINFKGGKMKKAYVVWYDNGQSYEDNYQCIEKIFSSYEAAAKYLDDQGLERVKQPGFKFKYDNYTVCDDEWHYVHKPYTCKNGYTDDCDGCPKYEEWVKLGFVPDDPCEEYDNMLVEYEKGMLESQEWEIREWEVVA